VTEQQEKEVRALLDAYEKIRSCIYEFPSGADILYEIDLLGNDDDEYYEAESFERRIFGGN
jgi:hypothetical protein